MNLLTLSIALASVVGQPNWDPTRVAVVNIPVVSERYQKTSDLEAQFEQVRQKLTKHREDLRNRIDTLQRSLKEELKPGSDAFRDRTKELAMLQAELQWFVDSEGQRVEKGLGASLKEIYLDIKTAAGQVAEERGIDIVLASDQLPDAEPDSSAQVRQQILLQKVVYWNPRVDITDAVVARLNENYRQSQKSAPTTAPPPREPHDQTAPSTRPGAAPDGQ